MRSTKRTQIFVAAPKRISVPDPTEQKLYKARERGRKRLVELWKATGPVLEIREVCRLLGATQKTVREMVDRHQLLALAKGRNTVFPAFQFNNGTVLRGILEVLEALETNSGYVVLAFLLSRNPDFDNKNAVDLLQAGDVETVISEARGFLRHGT
jgi:hypothetical protein